MPSFRQAPGAHYELLATASTRVAAGSMSTGKSRKYRPLRTKLRRSFVFYQRIQRHEELFKALSVRTE
jgi:hypothetical protein